MWGDEFYAGDGPRFACVVWSLKHGNVFSFPWGFPSNRPIWGLSGCFLVFLRFSAELPGPSVLKLQNMGLLNVVL